MDSYNIVGWYPTWGKTLMAEMEMQLANDVLRDSSWLNKQIGGHFNPHCFDDLTQNDIERWMSFDKGNEHVSWPCMYKLGSRTKYVHPDDVESYLNNGWQFGRARHEKQSAVRIVKEFELFDIETSSLVTVTNQSEFATTHGIPANNITRLLRGELDVIKGKWTLNPLIARQRFKFEVVDSGLKFESCPKMETYFGVKRGGCHQMIVSGEIKKLVPESKSDYIARLSNMTHVKTSKIESISIIMENSFKDILNPLSIEERVS